MKTNYSIFWTIALCKYTLWSSAWCFVFFFYSLVFLNVVICTIPLNIFSGEFLGNTCSTWFPSRAQKNSVSNKSLWWDLDISFFVLSKYICKRYIIWGFRVSCFSCGKHQYWFLYICVSNRFYDASTLMFLVFGVEYWGYFYVRTQ